MIVGLFSRFGEKDHIAFLPKTRGVPKEKARSVNNTQDLKYIGGEVEEKDRLESVRSWRLLGLEVGHSVLDGVCSNNMMEVLHDSGSEGWCVVVRR